MADIVYEIDGPADALADVVRALEARSGATNRVVGIAIGGCVKAVGTARRGGMRDQAHAHTRESVHVNVDADGTEGPERVMRGWICVNSAHPERLLTASGAPSRLLIHEVAHIASGTGHDVRWRQMVGRLGAPSEAKRWLRYSAAVQRTSTRVPQ